MRPSLLLLVTACLALPASGEAQGIAAIMRGVRDGGGWVSVPIESGQGSFSTVPLPTMGMQLTGCLNVWYGHSGTWEIVAKDRVSREVLEVDAEPGVGVPFAHQFGMQAQVDFEFRWSEPRDTTLLLWVGLEMRGEGAGEVCYPGG